MKRYVIVGNGTAAAGAIEGIRDTDKEGSITVISEEMHPVYSRPLISYLLEGKTDEERMSYRDSDFYDRNGCSVIYGKKATGIRDDIREVYLSDGTVVPYDELLIATGSSPFVPPFKGLDTVEERYSFMTLDDALDLREAVKEDTRVFIVGGGLIGLKCAEGLSSITKDITVTDLQENILSSILDTASSKLMQKHLEENGITFLLGDSAERFEADKAYMRTGKTVEFDVLVLAVGVRPNISLIKDIGGETGRAITVNCRMETSVPHIYAAGDCTETKDVSSGTVKVMALMPNAYMEGHTAGVNMAGGSSKFQEAIPMNSIGLFGLHAMTAGSYEGEAFEEVKEKSIKRLFTKDGLLKGFILVGADERAGIYTRMIRERIPLETVDFEMLKRTASTAAFGEEARRRVFGGLI